MKLFLYFFFREKTLLIPFSCVIFLAKCVVLLSEGKRLIIRAATDGKLETWKEFFSDVWRKFSRKA